MKTHRAVNSAQTHRAVTSAQTLRAVSSAQTHRAVSSAQTLRAVGSAQTHREVSSAQTHRAVSSAQTASAKTKHSFASLAFTLLLINHDGASNTLYCQGNSFLSFVISFLVSSSFVNQCLYLLSQRTQLRNNSFHVPLCARVS